MFTLQAGKQHGVFTSTGGVSHCLNAGGMGRIDYETETFVAHILRGDGFDASEDGTGRGTPIVPCLTGNGDSHSGYRDSDGLVPVSVALRGREGGATAELGDEVAGALSTGGGGGNKAHALTENAVRRLTPRECERLQGFPDDYTEIPYHGKTAADGPRYKALGNSMAVPVMAWIGERIQQVDQIIQGEKTNGVTDTGSA